MLILVYAPLSSFSISGSIGKKKNINNKINPPYLHEKAQDLNLKKKILDPYPPSCSLADTYAMIVRL